ncbi:hypothetical protein [Paenarthrobacter nitroguajacolicus]
MADSERRSGPTPVSVAAGIEWDQLTAESLRDTRASANRWRDGLAALVTLVTAGLVVSGPANLDGIALEWRVPIIALIVGGLFATVFGLIFALQASAGRPRAITFEEFADRYGTRSALHAVDVEFARKDLRKAQRLAIPGLFAIILGTGVWVVSPVPAKTPPAFAEVSTQSERICGTLTSGDGGEIVMAVNGEKVAVHIPYAQIVNMRVVSECAAGRSSR